MSAGIAVDHAGFLCDPRKRATLSAGPVGENVLPANGDPPVDHGLAAHSTRWFHAMTLWGSILGSPEGTEAALDWIPGTPSAQA